MASPKLRGRKGKSDRKVKARRMKRKKTEKRDSTAPLSEFDDCLVKKVNVFFGDSRRSSLSPLEENKKPGIVK